jgi:hypothetical protein
VAAAAQRSFEFLFGNPDFSTGSLPELSCPENPKRFQRAADAQDQLDDIRKAQDDYRKGRHGPIDSIQKSEQRERTAFDRIRNYEDSLEEFDQSDADYGDAVE